MEQASATAQHARELIVEHLRIEFAGDAETSAMVEQASVGNLKHTWVSYGAPRDWVRDDSEEFLRHATQVKNIWVPYGAERW